MSLNPEIMATFPQDMAVAVLMAGILACFVSPAIRRAILRALTGKGRYDV